MSRDMGDGCSGRWSPIPSPRTVIVTGIEQFASVGKMKTPPRIGRFLSVIVSVVASVVSMKKLPGIQRFGEKKMNPLKIKENAGIIITILNAVPEAPDFYEEWPQSMKK